MLELFGVNLSKTINEQQFKIQKEEIFSRQKYLTIIPPVQNSFFKECTIIHEINDDSIDIIIASSRDMFSKWTAEDIIRKMKDHFYNKYQRTHEIIHHQNTTLWTSLEFFKLNKSVIPLKPEFNKFCGYDNISTQLDILAYGTSDLDKVIEISLCKLPKSTEEITDDYSDEEFQIVEDYLNEIEFDKNGL